jgi:prepilin-type N-terminal cleavage/methylation domain-containing protein
MNRDQKGFTLIESIIAIVVIGLALPAAIQAFGTARQSMNVSDQAPTASGLAKTAALALYDMPWPPCGSATSPASPCPGLPAVDPAFPGWTLAAVSDPFTDGSMSSGDAVMLSITATSPLGDKWSFKTLRGKP